MTGSLVVVGTPLGNLDDLSPRGRATLASADIIACEDTRRTGRLLELIDGRGARLVVVNDHTEAAATPGLVRSALDGAAVALVTDAGMPSVSDPGSALVAAMHEAGVVVTVVPGPSAVSTAIAGSGIAAGRFTFEGFLPRKGAARAERLAEIAAERRAAVFYESPHRMARTVAELVEVCGPRRVVAIGRELTKLHEEWFRGTLGDAGPWLGAAPKGEFVVVVSGTTEERREVVDDDIVEAIEAERAGGASMRDAIATVASSLGVPKRRVYDLAHGDR